MEQVEKFKYLGVWFSSDGRYGNEIDGRIVRASAVLRELWRTVVAKSEISGETKLSVFKSVYIPTLTYGHELLIITK